MKRMLALVLAGGLWLGMSSAANAQFSLSIGPYAGGYGSYYGSGYGVPYTGYGLTTGVLPGATTYYSSSYFGAAPAVTTYSSVVPYAYPYGGYYGAAPYAYGSGYYGASPIYRPYYGGVGGYGFRRGFYGGRW